MTLLLDIRTRAEYEKGHVPGALLVETPLPPLTPTQINTLTQRLYTIVRNVSQWMCIRVYCKKGKRAALAVQLLRQWGYYNAMSLGGVETHALL